MNDGVRQGGWLGSRDMERKFTEKKLFATPQRDPVGACSSVVESSSMFFLSVLSVFSVVSVVSSLEEAPLGCGENPSVPSNPLHLQYPNQEVQLSLLPHKAAGGANPAFAPLSLFYSL